MINNILDMTQYEFKDRMKEISIDKLNETLEEIQYRMIESSGDEYFSLDAKLEQIELEIDRRELQLEELEMMREMEFRKDGN